MEKNNPSIAIIGLSCRFPHANTPKELWNLLFEGKSVIDTIPADRWNIEEYYDPDPTTPGKTNQKVGGFLDNIHHFDPYFFNISPKEAIEMNPSQKVMMELAWELYESSSLREDQFKGTKTGVFVGNIWADFEHLRKMRKAEINNFSGIGQSSNVIANRISYHFGLTGPSLVIDTGCSASLVALMLAVQSLRDRTSHMCIAGGVNHMLDPEEYVYLAKFGGLSSKGRCSAFDADADGFVRGEGAGAVLLKRLEDAERDGDKIYGVIRGGAITNNGYNVNMPATSKQGQLEVMAQAYLDAGVSPEEVAFVEAHGTGTRLGDPVETGALGEFFAGSRNHGNPLLVGSVKTNLGHCESSSGIAGVLKTVLAFQHRTLPKNLHFTTPNPEIDFEGWKLKVPTEHVVFPTNSPQKLVAGVSSYGWGGTNVHVVLEEYRPKTAPAEPLTGGASQPLFLPLSARTPKALQEYAATYANFLHPEATGMHLPTICSATANQKTGFEYKKMFFGKNASDLIGQLNDFAHQPTNALKPQKHTPHAKVVFVFPGQGAQWLGMGKELYENEPAFKQAIDDCAAAFSPHVDWSLLGEMHALKEQSQLHRIDVVQPYLFAMQVALAKLWMSKGIVPASVVGHSMGEVAAAYVAGALTIHDAANIICTRSKLMATLSNSGGAMAVTELDKQQAEELVAKKQGKISLAVINSPKSTVLAGDKQTIESILAELNEKNLFCRQVNVDVASHSPQMDLIKDQLFEKVKDVKPAKGSLAIYSTVRNQTLSGEELDANYWRDNLRNTVLFASVTQQLLEDEHQLFVEVSPHPVLGTALRECTEQYRYPHVSVVGSLHRDNGSCEEMAKNISLVYESGHPIDWAQFYGVRSVAHVELPSYPLQKENYEIKDLSAHFEHGHKSSSHPLLGNRIKLADADSYYWESRISLLNLPYLAHHQVNGTAVFPGGFYIKMIHAAARQVDGHNQYAVHDLEFVRSLELNDHEAVHIQVKIDTANGELTQFNLFRQLDGEAWELVCRCALKKDEAPPLARYEQPGNIQIKLDKAHIYKSFRNIGVTFKDTFQNIDHFGIDEDCVYAMINLDANDVHKPELFHIPPMLLDNCLHPLFGKAFADIDDKTVKIAFVQGVKQIRIGKITSSHTLYHTKTRLYPLQRDDHRHTISLTGDIYVYDHDHNLVMELTGATAKIIDTLEERASTVETGTQNVLEQFLNEREESKRRALVETYLINLVADASKASPDQLDTTMTFKNMGIDSLTTVQLRNLIEKQFHLKLSIKLFYQYPSLGEFATALIGQLNQVGNGATMAAEGANKWLVAQTPNPHASSLLFLFHDAGGSIRLFEKWPQLIDGTTETITVQLPGRDDRTDEPLLNDLETMMGELLPLMAQRIDRPFYVYGHSMGGLIAFEAVRRLQHQFGKQAEALVVSGTPCLKGYTNHFVNTIFEQHYSDEQLLALITPTGAAPLDAANDSVKELLKALRHDFELLHNYRYREMATLNCRITAIHARNDDRVNLDDVNRWSSETSSSFHCVVVDGGHNFVYTDALAAARVVNESIAKAAVVDPQ